MDNFSAIGRPQRDASASEKFGNTMNSLSANESWGAGPANLLPVKFTDESLISVPVMRPEDVGKSESLKPAKKSLFSSRRKSANENFIMKKVPRGEYLKFYAKDDDGKYIGTEQPADDCILRNAEDIAKYRGAGSIRNEADNFSNADTLVSKHDKAKDDDVVR